MTVKDYTTTDAGNERRRNILGMSYAEVAERLAEPGQDTVLVPMGSTEKHGAHIPLGTDSYVTMEVVYRAAPLWTLCSPRSSRSGTPRTTWGATRRVPARSPCAPIPTGGSCTMWPGA